MWTSSPPQTSKHRIPSQVNKAEPVEDTNTDTQLINIHLYNYLARQEGTMNPLILLRVHKIVLCISIKNKRKKILNATTLLKEQINGVKTWKHSRDQLLLSSHAAKFKPFLLHLWRPKKELFYLVGFFPLKESLEKYFNVICLLNNSNCTYLANQVFIASKTLLTVPYILMECHGGFVY